MFSCKPASNKFRKIQLGDLRGPRQIICRVSDDTRDVNVLLIRVIVRSRSCRSPPTPPCCADSGSSEVSRRRRGLSGKLLHLGFELVDHPLQPLSALKRKNKKKEHITCIRASENSRRGSSRDGGSAVAHRIIVRKFLYISIFPSTSRRFTRHFILDHLIHLIRIEDASIT